MKRRSSIKKVQPNSKPEIVKVVKPKIHLPEPDIGWFVALLTYLSYAILISFGHFRDFLGKFTRRSRYLGLKTKKGYSDLLKNWESFYTRRLYHRIQDCWNRPISSAPGAHIDVMERVSNDNSYSYQTTGKVISCLNLGSYNYLGFADDWKETCSDNVINSLENWPMSMCSSRMDFGTTSIHQELEETVASFVGKEEAMVFSMGYGTNLSTISVLTGAGSLIVSDSLNHTSIVNGARGSSALIRVFRNNDAAHLEQVLREAVVYGQPKSFRPWKKIWVMVEGIYSMEGVICNLAEIVKVCKKYKAYIYVDEAHSIGALGASGRGVCEQTGVNPADVDILMGTFTKSFSGMGGYIASSKKIITFLKTHAAGLLYHNAMSPVVCTQVLTAFHVIMGKDGTTVGIDKINRLKTNSNYFRDEMIRIGFHVVGDYDSPIVPVMIYFPCKISAFSRECLKRGLAIVVVGFPATSVVMSRARFCISAGHTMEDLKHAVSVLSEVADLLCLKYDKHFLGV